MSAADDIKDKLRDAIAGAGTEVIQIPPVQLPLSEDAANGLRESLFSFFSAANPPDAVVSPFDAVSMVGEGDLGSIGEARVFNYGSGDADDIINTDARDVDLDLLAGGCGRLRGYVLLVFPIGEIFRRCSRYSLMKSRVVDFQSQNQREHLANLIALTEDEWELFGEDFLYGCAVNVHNLLGAYGRSAGVRSMVFDLGSVASPGTVVYALNVPEGGFFHNYVLQLYESVASALYYSVLQQWAIWCNDAGEAQACGSRFSVFAEAIVSFRDVGRPNIVRPKRYF
jgi:hypothetical protein